jgi:5-methylcytosine-specific restriction endonuclease McrA
MSKSMDRRARRLNAFQERVDRKTLYDQHAGICGICRTPVSFKEMTIDHVIPLAKGGIHSYANTQPAHEECNLAKGCQMPDGIVISRPSHRKANYFNRPTLAA